MHVLDVGCGTGNPPVRARLSGTETLIGADIDTASLRTARVRYPGREFVCCQAESLPFANATFDVLFRVWLFLIPKYLPR